MASLVNADLHIHSKYARGTSINMEIPLLAQQSKLKGINLLATGDCIHRKWLDHLKETLSGKDGIYEYDEMKFVLQTEVQDKNRVHQIIFLPDFSKAEELREKLMRHSPNIDADGRPWLRLNGEEIAETVLGCEGLIGPAHAFTPYFGILAHFSSLKECYGKFANNVHFLELGLSADSLMADKISELHRVAFLSNSDSHSPYPIRLAREFNVIEIEDFTFTSFKKAIEKEGGKGIKLNCGFYPQHGKYYATRCKNCPTYYTLEEAIKLKWRCQKCKGSIKKGVSDRIKELSDSDGNPNRAKYIHIYPLSEIIAVAHGIENPSSVKVSGIWQSLIEKFGNEIEILINAKEDEIKRIDEKTAIYIKAFREDKIEHIPGGGGVYGKLLPLGQKANIDVFKKQQKSLMEF